MRCPQRAAETAAACRLCAWCGAPRPRRAIWREPTIIAYAASAALISLPTAVTIIASTPGRSRTPDTPATRATYAPAGFTPLVLTVDTRPAVAGGTVYAGSDDGTVYALDAATGGLRRAYTAGSYVEAIPAVAEGTIYAAAMTARYAR